MKLLLRFLLLLAAAVFFLPTLATLLLSFYPDGQAGLTGYDELFFDCFKFYTMFWNSVIYAYAITALQLVIILPAAFAFSFARFKAKEALFFFYIILMMMPLQVMILPNYIGLRDMGILNTRAGIILPMIFSPFGVVVLRQYMKGMDGAKALRQEIVSCRGWDDLESVLAHFNGHMDAPSEHLSPDTPCAAASGSHDGNIKTGDPHAGQD